MYCRCTAESISMYELKIKSRQLAACVGLDMSLQNPSQDMATDLCVGVWVLCTVCNTFTDNLHRRSGWKQRCLHSCWLIQHKVWAELLPLSALCQANNILLTLKIGNTRWEHLTAQVRHRGLQLLKKNNFSPDTNRVMGYFNTHNRNIPTYLIEAKKRANTECNDVNNVFLLQAFMGLVVYFGFR